MESKKLQTDSLIPADYNSRKKLKAGDAGFEKIKNSIREEKAKAQLKINVYYLKV